MFPIETLRFTSAWITEGPASDDRVTTLIAVAMALATSKVSGAPLGRRHDQQNSVIISD